MNYHAVTFRLITMCWLLIAVFSPRAQADIELLQAMTGHQDPQILAVAVPDNSGARHSVSVGNSGEVILWNLSNRTATWRVQLRPTAKIALLSTAFSPDLNYIGVGGTFGKLFLLAASTGAVAHELTASTVFFGDFLHVLAFSNDGRMVACVSAFGVVTVFATESGKKISSFKAQSPHQSGVRFSENLVNLVVTGEKSVSIYDVESGKLMKSYPSERIYSAGITRDTRYLALTHGNRIDVIALESLKVLKSIPWDHKELFVPTLLEFSMDMSDLLVWSIDTSDDRRAKLHRVGLADQQIEFIVDAPAIGSQRFDWFRAKLVADQRWLITPSLTDALVSLWKW